MTVMHGRRLRTRAVVFVFLSAVALAVDQISKVAAQILLPKDGSIRLIPGILSLTLVRNPGASLGMGSSMTWVIAILAIFACIALFILMLRTQSMVWTLALALAFSGAAGNLVDRVAHADGFLNGKVVDFLDYGWSVGNIADIYLLGAAIVLMVLIVKPVPFGAADSHKQVRKQRDAA